MINRLGTIGTSSNGANFADTHSIQILNAVKKLSVAMVTLIELIASLDAVSKS